MKQTQVEFIGLLAADITLNSVSVGSTSISLPVARYEDYYKVTGTPTLTSSLTIQSSGTPTANTIIRFLWDATVTLAGNTITLFGWSVPSALALTKFEVLFIYDTGTTTWDKYLKVSSELSTTGADTDFVTGTAGTDTYVPKWNADGDIVDGYAFLDENDMVSDSATSLSSQQAIKAYVDAHNTFESATPKWVLKDSDCTDSDDNATIEASATDTGSGTEDIDVTLKQQVAGTLTAFLTADADGNITVGDGTRALVLAGTVAASGAVKDENDMVSDSATHIATQQSIKAYVDGYSSRVETLTNKTVDVSSNTFTNISASNLTTELKTECVTANASFEATEYGTIKVKVPFKCSVEWVHICVTTAIGGGGAGAISVKDNGGNNMDTAGDTTITAGATVGTVFAIIPDTNNDIAADEVIQITTDNASTTGRVQLSFKLLRQA